MAQAEILVCPICKEWTTKEENCCGAIEGTDSEEFKRQVTRKYKQLRKLSFRTFGKQLGEDIAQEAALGLCEGKSLKQQNYFAIVDAARKRGSGSYCDRSGNIEPTRPSYEEFDPSAFSVKGYRADSSNSEGYRADIFNFIQAVSMLTNPRHIQSLILINTYEFTLLEVSKFFGVTESRVSQIHTLSKERIKKVFISQGLLPSEQSEMQQTKPRLLSSENQIVESLPVETLRDLEEIQRTKAIRESELAARAFFKIPKAVFIFNRKTEKKDQGASSPMAKIKLEGKSFICPKMEKKTINFWPQKSNC